MKIYDINDNLLEHPDLSLGRLEDDRIFIAHHDAIEPVEETYHYEVVAQYPNGGKDVRKIIDTPAVAAQEAWDEYEDIQRYIPYTEDEIARIEAERNRPNIEERINALEAAMLEMLLGGAV